jgi:hypothetical protein
MGLKIASSPGSSHIFNVTTFSMFSTCNIENVGWVWGRGYLKTCLDNDSNAYPFSVDYHCCSVEGISNTCQDACQTVCNHSKHIISWLW